MLSSGIVAERVDLRVFLTAGLLGSGLMTVMFGAAHSLGIHSVWYLVTVQLLAGLIQVGEGAQGTDKEQESRPRAQALHPPL